MGVVNILKTLSQSSGPSITGVLAGRNHFWVAFVVAGSLKATYDLLLLAFFGGRVETKKGVSEVVGHPGSGESADTIDADGVSSPSQGSRAEGTAR